MSKEKQIEEMAKELCGSTMCDLETYNRCRMPRGNCSRCQRVAEDLYNAGYRKQSDWISVNERLPEDDGFVLLCTSKGAIIKGHYEHKYGRWSGLNNRLNVTHWMPLPEPPMMKEGAGK